MSESDRQMDAVAATREFFAALEALDIARFLDLWADDGIQEMPFAPGTFPKRLVGKAAIARQYEPLPDAFVSMQFFVRRLLPTAQADSVVAEYDGRIRLKQGGAYDNRYVGVFEFNGDGKLSRLTEYFDPFVLAAGFPGAAELAMSDTARLTRMIEQVASAVDRGDWPSVHALFSPSVHVDYTSVSGAPAGPVAVEELVSSWSGGLSRYAATKHNFSDIHVTVDGDSAVAKFTGHATHCHGSGDRWSCGGDYVYAFTRTPAGWKISGATFLMAWEQGVR